MDSVGVTFTVKFTSILCSNAYIVFYPIYDQTYDVSLGKKIVITELNWEKSDLNCPDITYKIIDSSTGAALDGIFSFSSSLRELSVKTSDPSKAKTYRVRITGYMGGFTQDVDFNVIVTDVCPQA